MPKHSQPRMVPAVTLAASCLRHSIILHPMQKLRFALLPIFFTSLVACNRTPSAPMLKAEVTCYLDGLDSGTKCTTGATSPEDPRAQNRSLRCGLNEKVTTTKWTFLESRRGKDVYRFSRSPEGTSTAAATQTKQIEFDGARVIVFEDPSQIVVIQPLKQ